MAETATSLTTPLPLRIERKDQVFARDDLPVGDFAFNATVANVFDDMVSRSVPLLRRDAADGLRAGG